MRICSYNVNGLRALYNKNALNNLFNDINPDILCIQESRCDEATFNLILESTNNELKGSVYSNPNNSGYSGVGLLSKLDLSIIPLEDISSPILDSEYYGGRIQVIKLTTDIVLVNTYSLNSGNKDELRISWDEYFYGVIKNLLTNYKVIICGDLNVVKDENDHWKGLSNVVDTAPGLMKYEHDAMNKLLNLGLIDSYKYINKDGNDKSWFSYRGNAYKNNRGWRLDYILVDNRLISNIKNALIYKDFIGSDHRPTLLDIDI